MKNGYSLTRLAPAKKNDRRSHFRQRFHRFIEPISDGPVRARRISRPGVHCSEAWAKMETTASLIILTPVLLPLMPQIGVDPLHFGVVLVLNLVIGLTTPPVGVCLFITCSIGQTNLEKLYRAILPFLLASILVLLICT